MNKTPLYAKFDELLAALEGESVLVVFATIRQLLREDNRLAVLVDTIQHVQEQEQQS